MNLFSQLSVNSGHSLSSMSKLPPMAMTKVYSSLQWRPLVLARGFGISTHFIKYSRFLLTKIEVSLATISDLYSLLAYPFMCLVSLILINNNIKKYKDVRRDHISLRESLLKKDLPG